MTDEAADDLASAEAAQIRSREALAQARASEAKIRARAWPRFAARCSLAARSGGRASPELIARIEALEAKVNAGCGITEADGEGRCGRPASRRCGPNSRRRPVGNLMCR